MRGIVYYYNLQTFSRKLTNFPLSRPLLMVGPTGTGKSAYVQQKLMHDLPQDKYLATFVNFSAQTSANMTQVNSALTLTQTNIWYVNEVIVNFFALIILCSLHTSSHTPHYWMFIHLFDCYSKSIWLYSQNKPFHSHQHNFAQCLSC